MKVEPTSTLVKMVILDVKLTFVSEKYQSFLT